MSFDPNSEFAASLRQVINNLEWEHVFPITMADVENMEVVLPNGGRLALCTRAVRDFDEFIHMLDGAQDREFYVLDYWSSTLFDMASFRDICRIAYGLPPHSSPMFKVRFADRPRKTR